VAEIVRFPGRQATPSLLSKKQLAMELGYSPRWVNLRMNEGMPVEPRANPSEEARFDLARVKAWLDARAEQPKLSLEQRVAALEAEIRELRKAG
jgi:phage terminase Nu1 subunit (DNA packaging protein)